MEGAKSVERSVQERADEMPLLRFGKSSGPAVVGVLASEVRFAMDPIEERVLMPHFAGEWKCGQLSRGASLLSS